MAVVVLWLAACWTISGPSKTNLQSVKQLDFVRICLCASSWSTVVTTLSLRSRLSGLWCGHHRVGFLHEATFFYNDDVECVFNIIFGLDSFRSTNPKFCSDVVIWPRAPLMSVIIGINCHLVASSLSPRRETISSYAPCNPLLLIIIPEFKSIDEDAGVRVSWLSKRKSDGLLGPMVNQNWGLEANVACILFNRKLVAAVADCDIELVFDPSLRCDWSLILNSNLHFVSEIKVWVIWVLRLKVCFAQVHSVLSQTVRVKAGEKVDAITDGAATTVSFPHVLWTVPNIASPRNRALYQGEWGWPITSRCVRLSCGGNVVNRIRSVGIES